MLSVLNAIPSERPHRYSTSLPRIGEVRLHRSCIRDAMVVLFRGDHTYTLLFIELCSSTFSALSADAGSDDARHFMRLQEETKYAT